MLYRQVELQRGITFENTKIGNLDWDNFDLERGGSKTIFVYFTNGIPKKADIVIGVDYRFLWRKWRWFFRFDGLHIDNWQWSKQPVGDLEPELNRLMDEALEEHRQAHRK